MNEHVLLKTRKVFLMALLLAITSVAWSQSEFNNGIRKGVVKVKFTSAMTTSLSQMTVTARSSGLTTGMTQFDAVAKTAKAKNMYRLFPYDAKYENKLRKHGLHLWYLVEVDENADPKTIASQFKQLKEVEIAEVDHQKILAPYKITPYTPGAGTLSTLPFNDPMLMDQWHYNNTSQMGYGDADINLFEAWTQTTGASDVIVSVHDQGVDVNHTDLKANIWINQAEANGTEGVDDDGNGYVDDINGWNFGAKSGDIDAEYHGTHVAGTIAAVNNNGIGVSGVAGGNGSGNGVKIMSMQILSGGATEKSYVYAANNGAVISQNSWGYSSPYYYDQSVLDAIDYFIEEAGDYEGSPMKGGIVIFASGNSNYDSEWYPGYHESILAVSSIGPEWKKASYSNYGTWVEIAAPGGEQDGVYGSKGGVLSTIPNGYAYMQGTSMACPHVSGIAALALANRTQQLTNDELWNKLITGVVNIDSYNPDYIGTLGSGAIDAALAIQNDQGFAPAQILNLAITGISQEFAQLAWTVPTDADDARPVSFQLYYHTQPITTANLGSAVKVDISNNAVAGTESTYEASNLLGLTTYYFAITSTDRWGNVSVLSNVISGTTNEGPSIAVDENSQSVDLVIDATSTSTASHDITILNNAAGVLRWNHLMRHKNTSLSWSASSLQYPAVSKTKSTGPVNVARTDARDAVGKLKSVQPVPMSFDPLDISYAYYATNIIGETDLSLTNSAAAKFSVTQAEGFNLTQVRMYLKHDPALGPVIVEIYQGSSPVKSNLVFAQEYSNWSANEAWAYINLDEQLYFENGTTFWVVFHVPAGNLFPLGIGFEADESYSANCYMSFDLGNKWAPLEEVLDTKDFAWAVAAASYNEHLGTYLTLEPGSGEMGGNEQSATTLTANASALINGSYSANVIITSNDAQNRELRIPVNLTVSGHQPDVKHIDIADFGSVFVGTEEVMELLLDNQGYGNFNSPSFTFQSGTQFEIEGYTPWQIKAREQAVVKIKFKPTAPGNINDIFTITNGTTTYEIPLFGVGAETAKIAITPESQIVNSVTIGDVVNAQVTVENTGAYPLKYFIPGFDENGISDNWPSDYHSYGYKFRTNYGSESNPIPYEFQDIASTGTKITDALKDDGVYYSLDMGFEFPYYGQNMQTLYIAQKGFTTFDNSVRPINTPNFPGNSYSPKGIISLLGTYVSLI
ncbi:MAG: S8 family serine peptidase, partial [Flammeovirgaceae bacterium]|nr:S8 family serine peptidase [Flammeovirgaceae bacterium]